MTGPWWTWILPGESGWGSSLGQEVLGLDNVFVPRPHDGSVTSCSPAVEKHTHTHTEIYHTENLRLLAHTNTHTACSAQLKCREVSRTLLGALSSPCSCSCLFCAPPYTHTFRSTSLVPLEQAMTTQGGSAAMATSSATSSCPPQSSILWWGPARNSFFLSTRPCH